MEKNRRRRWVRPIAGIAGLLLAAISLGGCVIEPIRPWHPHYYY